MHISFVRSITMDSFKAEEILRMDNGGNKKCKAFFAAATEFHEGMSIAEQYGSVFGEDYKEKVPLLSFIPLPLPLPSFLTTNPIVGRHLVNRRRRRS